MAAPPPAVAPPTGAAPAAGPTTILDSPILKTLARSAAIYVAITWITGPNSPLRTKSPAVTLVAPAADGDTSGGATVVPVTVGNAVTVVPQLEVVDHWPAGTLLDVFIHLSTSPSHSPHNFNDLSLPSTTFSSVSYSKTSPAWSFEWNTEFEVPESVQRNGSLWADIFITREGTSPVPGEEGYEEGEVVHTRKALTRYMPLRKIREVKNLLSTTKLEANETLVEPSAAVVEILPIISYYHPNISLELVTNPGALAYSSLPPVVQQHIILAHPEERNEQGRGYMFPITWSNDFWLMDGSMNPINETTTKLPLKITFTPTSYTKFQIMATLDDSFRQQSASTGSSGGELDEVKRMLTETNPILLISTVIVTILHMLFEMLAFTSDISHWKSKKELVGVSVRTICTNVFVQFIILLYLMDNNEKTSWMILFSQGTGLCIEAWKITKAVDVAVVPTTVGFLPYTLEITDKHVLSEEELKTQEYDQLAFRWVSYVTIPTLVGYTIYSMVYNEHRGWYSFVISTLTSFVYMFGFIQLVPMLIINYKLKSVAHLPMKTLTYKFFATIVDDFFSFVIKMPMLHRLACFRDDAVFLVLLYQMYIYKVDHSRTNEYGQKLTEEAAAKLVADKAAKSGENVEGVAIESKKDI